MIQSMLLGILLPLLPRVFGELGRLFVVLFEAARPYVAAAADNKEFPNGETRHVFVVEHLLPLLKESGSKMLDIINQGVLHVAAKAAYEVTAPKPKT
jgi:hypothetical protein